MLKEVKLNLKMQKFLYPKSKFTIDAHANNRAPSSSKLGNVSRKNINLSSFLPQKFHSINAADNAPSSGNDFTINSSYRINFFSVKNVRQTIRLRLNKKKFGSEKNSRRHSITSQPNNDRTQNEKNKISDGHQNKPIPKGKPLQKKSLIQMAKQKDDPKTTGLTRTKLVDKATCPPKIEMLSNRIRKKKILTEENKNQKTIFLNSHQYSNERQTNSRNFAEVKFAKKINQSNQNLVHSGFHEGCVHPIELGIDTRRAMLKHVPFSSREEDKVLSSYNNPEIELNNKSNRNAPKTPIIEYGGRKVDGAINFEASKKEFIKNRYKQLIQLYLSSYSYEK